MRDDYGMRAAVFASAVVAVLVAPSRADACGGGLVTSSNAAVEGNVQRIFIATNMQKTEIVTQIAVPATNADYGALLPLPAEPTIDAMPVEVAELDALDESTRVRIFHNAASSSSGCGCGAKDAAPGGARNGGDNVFVADPVAIGPVTATALTGDTPAAVEAWLSANGFAIPPQHSALLAEYAEPGRWFVAIKRTDGATGGGESSVGVHFTLQGDQRALPLRFAQIGAASKVAFVVFVAAPEAVGPGLPFAALTVNDLDEGELELDYSMAIERAVDRRGGHAFVVENVASVGILGSKLASFATGTQQVTRLSSIINAAELTADVAFDAAAPANVSGTITLGLEASYALAAPIAVLALLALRRRRRSNG